MTRFFLRHRTVRSDCVWVTLDRLDVDRAIRAARLSYPEADFELRKTEAEVAPFGPLPSDSEVIPHSTMTLEDRVAALADPVREA